MGAGGAAKDVDAGVEVVVGAGNKTRRGASFPAHPGPTSSVPHCTWLR